MGGVLFLNSQVQRLASTARATTASRRDAGVLFLELSGSVAERFACERGWYRCEVEACASLIGGRCSRSGILSYDGLLLGVALRCLCRSLIGGRCRRSGISFLWWLSA